MTLFPYMLMGTHYDNFWLFYFWNMHVNKLWQVIAQWMQGFAGRFVVKHSNLPSCKCILIFYVSMLLFTKVDEHTHEYPMHLKICKMQNPSRLETNHLPNVISQFCVMIFSLPEQRTKKSTRTNKIILSAHLPLCPHPCARGNSAINDAEQRCAVC